jgi:hypothetical protein
MGTTHTNMMGGNGMMNGWNYQNQTPTDITAEGKTLSLFLSLVFLAQVVTPASSSKYLRRAG